MSEQTAQKQQYMVSVYESEEADGAFIFTFVPTGLQQERGPGGPRSACRNSSSPCAKHQVGWRSTGVELRTIRVLLVRKWKQKLPLGCTIGKSGSIASPLWWPRWTSGPRKWAGPPVAWKRDLMMHGSASTGFQPCSFSKTLAGLYSNRLGDLPRVPMVWLISTSCRLTTTSPATTTTTASGISIAIRSAAPTLWFRSPGKRPNRYRRRHWKRSLRR